MIGQKQKALMSDRGMPLRLAIGSRHRRAMEVCQQSILIFNTELIAAHEMHELIRVNCLKEPLWPH
jgi:hypothetical protein